MTSPSLLKRVDPFLLMLVIVVTLASLLPARGVEAVVFEWLADIAIALLFFLHGAKLSRQAIVAGIGNLKLHALTLSATYVVFPLVGLAVVAAVQGWINPLLVSGVLFLTLLPSTVQSSIAFTSIARGNVAAAVCSASLSNLLGIIVTPLLVGLLIHSGTSGEGFDWGGVQAIVIQLLLPFLAGHFLRPLIGRWVDGHKKLLGPIDRGSILLVVYSAFSAAVDDGIWQALDVVDLIWLLGLSALILAAVMAYTTGAARVAGLRREDSVVLLFCGSKKSLASGVPMAGALFAPAEVGMIVLPLMIFHQLQLFVCAWLAARMARRVDAAGEAPSDADADADAGAGNASAAVPRGADAIASAAAARGVTIEPACRDGVAANCDLLASHAARMRGEGTPQ
ncbi:bile acid:sodium symporter family protein [Croceicoccus marinus]|uniref:Bile acid:sodium symporter n=1 Tax=Croceicoccus marinus TaxID=450378 RepID=A0A7G6VQP7_9SPHN|nr:bile acid:sodium symporter family protein [Croceicoccus marinus]QNE04062.1 bile acid:sodium symporter [Croceicoccus marinus]